MSAFVIRFDFPEADGPIYAGHHKGALGFAPTVATAIVYEDADAAARVLVSGYGESVALHGRVVRLEAGRPVSR